MGKALLDPNITNVHIVNEDYNLRVNSFDSSDIKKDINSFRMNAVKMLSIQPSSFVQTAQMQKSPELRIEKNNAE